jgi:hypothetical protein
VSKFRGDVTVEQHFDEIYQEFMWTQWEAFSTEKNCIRIKGQLESLINIIWSAAKLDGDPLFWSVSQIRSAKTVSDAEVANIPLSRKRRNVNIRK